MSQIKINPEQLQSTIQGVLSMIPQQVDNVIDEASKMVSKEAVNKLKAASPKGKGKKSGRYAKGWSTKKIDNMTVIYNRTDYQLTHLLENGHDIVKNGKKVGHYNGIKHIKPVEETVQERMVEEVEKGLSKL